MPSSPECRASRDHERRPDKEIAADPHPDTWLDYPHLRLAHRDDIDPETGLPLPGLLHVDRLQSVLRASYEELLGRHVSQQEIQDRLVQYPSVDQMLEEWTVE